MVLFTRRFYFFFGKFYCDYICLPNTYLYQCQCQYFFVEIVVVINFNYQKLAHYNLAHGIQTLQKKYPKTQSPILALRLVYQEIYSTSKNLANQNIMRIEPVIGCDKHMRMSTRNIVVNILICIFQWGTCYERLRHQTYNTCDFYGKPIDTQTIYHIFLITAGQNLIR